MSETNFTTSPSNITRHSFKLAITLLPALFLLILGAGNLIVGTYKKDEYHQIFNELSSSQTIAVPYNASPLTRIRLLEEKESRIDKNVR
jgi:hypothetical protein